MLLDTWSALDDILKTPCCLCATTSLSLSPHAHGASTAPARPALAVTAAPPPHVTSSCKPLRAECRVRIRDCAA